MPVQALDHASGYLLAFGILAAKCRSALDLLASSCDPGSGSGLERASSSWQVEVCLAGTSAWLRSLGRVHGALAWDVPNEIQPNGQEVYDLLQPVKYRRGAAGGARSDENGDGSGVTLFGLRHAAQVNGHSPGWDQVPGDLGVDRAEWW